MTCKFNSLFQPQEQSQRKLFAEACEAAKQGREGDFFRRFSIGTRAGHPDGYRVRLRDGKAVVQEAFPKYDDPPGGTIWVTIWHPEQ